MTDKEKAAPQEKQPFNQLPGCAEVAASDDSGNYSNSGSLPAVTSFEAGGMVMGALLNVAQAAEVVHVDMGEGRRRLERDASLDRAIKLGRSLLLRIDAEPAFVLLPEPGAPGLLRVWLFPAFAQEIGGSV